MKNLIKSIRTGLPIKLLAGFIVVFLIILVFVFIKATPQKISEKILHEDYRPPVVVEDTTPPKTQTIEVAIPDFDKTDWKKFTNEKYGFEIQVPNYFKEVEGARYVGIFRSAEKEVGYQAMLKNCADSAHPGVCSGDKPHFDLSFEGWNTYLAPSENLIKGKDRIIIGGISWLRGDANYYYDQKEPVYSYLLEESAASRPYTFISENEELLRKILSTYKMSVPFLWYVSPKTQKEPTITFSAPQGAIESRYYITCNQDVKIFFSDAKSESTSQNICGTSQANIWDAAQPNALIMNDTRSMRAETKGEGTKYATIQMVTTMKGGEIVKSASVKVFVSSYSNLDYEKMYSSE